MNQQLARDEGRSYTDGPAKRQVWRLGSPLKFTFLGPAHLYL
jgi:hypothetical protein